ncbi:methyltransferase [Pontibacillus chungwhensis BH030062]|uniref:Methyltransferase n=1 Tax=Pontibacillus chungwhensis BH030062 TaxID=1385513 RepID=A0A0A2UVL4_9BACI|nr:class I SAM-dependent methyltransferase [Pontibacillus chungwhensis]KGP90546.1 methyltransferase [Pontibacillus chungwhensis BH030062]
MKSLEQFYNFEEYDDPARYDEQNSGYKRDIPLLMKWAEKQNGPIIDLACGTGRATFPLARAGYDVTGIDVHQGMLEEAKRKAHNEDNINWLLEDCANLNLHRKVDFIFTVGHSFQHFLTNDSQDGLLASVSRHLNEGGVFIFGPRFPNAYELISEPEEEIDHSYMDEATGHTVDVYHLSRYDTLSQIQYNTKIRRYKNQHEEVVHEGKSLIALRFVFPKEMERLLEKHGLSILHVYGDWEEGPISAASSEMIYVCKK